MVSRKNTRNFSFESFLSISLIRMPPCLNGYSLFMRRSFWRPYPLKPARCLPSNRAELLLIYRIPSHTNPKRRDFPLKQPGQKSAKEEGPEQRKGPKRAVNGSPKVQTHIWEHDFGCSSHLTPTKNRMEPIPFKTAWFLTRMFSFPDRGFPCPSGICQEDSIASSKIDSTAKKIHTIYCNCNGGIVY